MALMYLVHLCGAKQVVSEWVLLLLCSVCCCLRCVSLHELKSVVPGALWRQRGLLLGCVTFKHI
jgi:hypothetical protein